MHHALPIIPLLRYIAPTSSCVSIAMRCGHKD